MASYPPPTDVLPIYNPSSFPSGDPSADLTLAEADSRYVSLSKSQTVSGSKIFPLAVGINSITNTGTITVPTSTGTLALTSQIPTSSDYVDRTTNQTISGTKSFTDPLRVVGSGSTTSTGGNLNVAPASTALSGASNYFWNVFGLPPTSGSTTGSTATVVIEGAPVNAGSTNNSALRVDSGNIRLTNGRLLSTALGTASAPALSIGASLNDGIYSSGAGNVNVSAGGTLRTTINSTNVLSTVRFQGPAGSLSGVTYGLNSANTGMYAPSANQVGLSANGTQTLVQTSTQTNFPVAGSVGTPSVYFSTDTTTGLYRPSANQISVGVSGALLMNISGSGVLMNNGLQVQNGNLSTSGLQVGLTVGSLFNQIQRGTGSISFSGATQYTQANTTVTFPTAFTGSTPQVIVTVNNNSGGNESAVLLQCRTSTLSTVVVNGIYLFTSSFTGSVGFNYIAFN